MRELDVGAHRDAPLHKQVALLVRMLERGVNSPLTSSCGRLFDAVSALAGIRKRVDYEAQAAIEFEAAIAGKGEGAAYPFELRADGSGWIIDTRPLFAALLNDLKCGVPAGIVSRRFHEGFVDVSALAGIRKRVNYEAQAAIEFEAAIADEGEVAGYPFEIRPEGSGFIIDTRPLFAAVVNDLNCAVPAGIVSRRFHEGFVDVLARTAKLIHAKIGLDNVCLSGGSFQNVFLLEHLKRRLEAEGLNVFTHSEVPCGDGGLSLGQALVAAHRPSY